MKNVKKETDRGTDRFKRGKILENNQTFKGNDRKERVAKCQWRGKSVIRLKN